MPEADRLDVTTADQSVQGASAQAEAERDTRSRSARRRLPAAAGAGAFVLVYLALCYGVSLSQPFTSDSTAVALQGWDLLHGNVLLNGWFSSDVNFYTFDLPIYGVTQVLLGIGATAMHAASALVFTLVFLAGAWLAVERLRGAQAWFRCAVLAAFLAVPLIHGRMAGEFLEVPDHYGTAAYLLAAFVVAARYPRHRYAPPALFVLLVLGQLGDLTVRYVAVPAVLVVWAAHWLQVRRPRPPQLGLALAAALSVPVEMVVRQALRGLGAFYQTPARSSIAPVSQWGRHLQDTWESLLGIYGVPLGGYGRTPGWVLFSSALAVLILALALFGIVRTLVRWGSAAPADRLLSVAVLVYLAAYAFSGVEISGGGGGYEFTADIALIAVLAARTVPAPSSVRLRIPLAATAVLAAFALPATGAFLRIAATPQQQLAAWLEARGLTYGIGDYWYSTSTVVDSGGEIAVRAVYYDTRGVQLYAWGTKQQWYDPSRFDADFVVLSETPGGPAGLDVANVEHVFGAPTGEYHPVKDVIVLTYRTNLLDKVTMPWLPASS